MTRFWFIIGKDQEDGVIESQLYIRQVSLNTFRQYQLVAKNGVAVRTHNVRLVQSEQFLNFQVWEI